VVLKYFFSLLQEAAEVVLQEAYQVAVVVQEVIYLLGQERVLNYQEQILQY
jgi:hypothetical protein